MCECGCGEYTPSIRFQGPENAIYTVSVYDSLNCECSNPAGVIITKITPEILDRWHIEMDYILSLPEFKFDNDLSEICFPIIDKQVVREILEDDLADIETDFKKGYVDSEMLAEEVSDLMQECVRQTINKYKKDFYQ